LAAETAKNALPVDRAVDRPTVTFWPLPATGRPPGRPKQTESCLHAVGRPCGRPDHVAASVHVSVHVGRLIRSTGYLVRSTVGVDRPSLAETVLVSKNM